MASATSVHTPATLSTPDANSGTTGSGGSSGNSGGATVERRCENADCNVVKLVSMVPRRKITQFITEPTVMEKPMLINGFTTIFQVDGTSAKLSEIKNPNGASISPKSIFRIVPNTHAHIVNYVVVDTDGDSMRKINESDPATMRKLLESQKVSADQMLKKLMVGHGTQSTHSTMTTPASNTNSSTNTLPMLPTPRPIIAANAATLGSIPKASTTYASTTTTAQQQQTPSIQLPMRMHPNLKITAVASAETVAALRASPTPTVTSSSGGMAAVVAAPPVVPLITPVPLANLQNIAAAPAPTPNVVDTVEKPVFDKMQAELQELRRTVAMLAEAQAKNLPTQQLRAVKRPRPN